MHEISTVFENYEPEFSTLDSDMPLPENLAAEIVALGSLCFPGHDQREQESIYKTVFPSWEPVNPKRYMECVRDPKTGELVGVCTHIPYHFESQVLHTRVTGIYIVDLMVNPDYQRHGLGRSLLLRAYQTAGKPDIISGFTTHLSSLLTFLRMEQMLPGYKAYPALDGSSVPDVKFLQECVVFELAAILGIGGAKGVLQNIDWGSLIRTRHLHRIAYAANDNPWPLPNPTVEKLLARHSYNMDSISPYSSIAVFILRQEMLNSGQ